MATSASSTTINPLILAQVQAQAGGTKSPLTPITMTGVAATNPATFPTAPVQQTQTQVTPTSPASNPVTTQVNTPIATEKWYDNPMNVGIAAFAVLVLIALIYFIFKS